MAQGSKRRASEDSTGRLRLLRSVPSEPPGTADGRGTVDPLVAVYREHRTFVYRTARQLGVPAAEAEDVVHDVFVAVGAKLDQRSDASSMRSWLFGFTKRVVLHHHRSRRRTERRLKTVEHEQRTLGVTSSDPQLEAERAEAARFVATFVEKLSGWKREVFMLSLVEGLPAPEIAEATGVNVNTVYARIRSIKAEFERATRRRRVLQGVR